MVALTNEEKQVVELFRRIKPGRRRHVLLEMARADADGWKRFRPDAEARLREAAKQQGKDWDQMSDPERQEMVEAWLDGGEQ